MFKASINSNVIAASTNIPFNIIENTNSNISYNSSTNVIEFNTPGWYDINFIADLTNVPVGDVEVKEFINNTSSSNSLFTETSVAISDYIHGNIIDAIKVVPYYIGNKANISFQVSVPCTVSNALLIIEKRR